MRYGKQIAVVATAVAVGVGLLIFIPPNGDEEQFDWGLHIVVFDVGQADAIAMVSPGGEAVVIDAGHGSTAAGKISEFLRNAEKNGAGVINNVKLGVVTHYDRDHVGGFASFGSDDTDITFSTVIDQGPSLKRQGATIYQAYLDWVGDPDDDVIQDPDEPNFVRRKAERGDQWNLGAARIKVVSVRGGTRHTANDLDLDPSAADIDENPGSIALLVTLGEFEFYTAGDQTSDDWESRPDAEIAVINANALGAEDDIDVFKVSHHGSETSNGVEFIQAIDPEVAIVSSKLGGDGLPKRITIKALTDNGALVYITGDGMENGNFTDSPETDQDDSWTPPAGSFLNSAGDVHVFVSADGSSYRVNAAGDDWREFSAVDDENVH